MEEKKLRRRQTGSGLRRRLSRAESAGIKFLTCSSRAGYAYGYLDELSVFADEKDAERIEGALKTGRLRCRKFEGCS